MLCQRSCYYSIVIFRLLGKMFLTHLTQYGVSKVTWKVRPQMFLSPLAGSPEVTCTFLLQFDCVFNLCKKKERNMLLIITINSEMYLFA